MQKFDIWIATFHILQGGNGWFWWLLVVMVGYGVDTGGFGWLLVVMVGYGVVTIGYEWF